MTEPEIECIGFKMASLIYKEVKEHIYQVFWIEISSLPIKVTDEFAFAYQKRGKAQAQTLADGKLLDIGIYQECIPILSISVNIDKTVNCKDQ